MTFLSACYDFLQRALIFFDFTVQTFYSETEVWINFRFSLANFSFQSGWFFVSVRILFCLSLDFVGLKFGFCSLEVRVLFTWSPDFVGVKSGFCRSYLKSGRLCRPLWYRLPYRGCVRCMLPVCYAPDFPAQRADLISSLDRKVGDNFGLYRKFITFASMVRTYE